jgi:D-alanyl-D-alanine dipeptidase
MAAMLPEDATGKIEEMPGKSQAARMQRAIRMKLAGLAAAALVVASGSNVDAQNQSPQAPSRVPSQVQPVMRPAGFVDVATIVPGLVVDMRYFGTHNFVGAKVDGYEAPACLLTRQAAAALSAVQRDLAPRNLGLKVFDCYRPVRAVAHFVRWARDGDTRTKAEFYPDIDKRSLFREGFIASRSGHSRGSTVDLTLVALPGGEELDMGTPFDLLSYRSSVSGPVSPQQRANRKILADAMRARGFVPYAKEWWHFTLHNEPFPNSYFDFPVK